MRAILISVLFIMTAIVLVTSISEGDGGMKFQLNRSGEAIRGHIQGMSP